jgi:hypothetical protein
MIGLSQATGAASSDRMKMSGWLAESLRRNRALTLFGLGLWLAMLPTLVLLGIDERELRGVNVWVKPLKFMASLGLFALTTAWFIGLLDDAARAGRAVRLIVWTIVVLSSAELAYIVLQAARGQASHYNDSSPLYVVLYGAMGVAAVALTATQAALAVLIARNSRPGLPALWRSAVLAGLWLTFVLGAGAGILLGGMQPASGVGMPVFGWHLGGGDLRVAHFIGMHAQQAVPLAGFALVRWPQREGGKRIGLLLFTTAYVAVWMAALASGLVR